MSEREELEGPAGRKDPIKTTTNAKLAVSFGALGLVILLWPVWATLLGILLLLIVFGVLWPLADFVGPMREQQRDFTLIVFYTAIIIAMIVFSLVMVGIISLISKLFHTKKK